MNEYLEDFVGPIVYHGSKTPDIEVIEPRPSKLTTEPVVFAATVLDIAVAMAGSWSDDDLSFGRRGQEEDGRFVRYILEELRSGVLEEFFSDRTYVYFLPGDQFKRFDGLQDFELASTNRIEPISFIEVSNPLLLLENSTVIEVKRFRS